MMKPLLTLRKGDKVWILDPPPPTPPLGLTTGKVVGLLVGMSHIVGVQTATKLIGLNRALLRKQGERRVPLGIIPKGEVVSIETLPPEYVGRRR